MRAAPNAYEHDRARAAQHRHCHIEDDYRRLRDYGKRVFSGNGVIFRRTLRSAASKSGTPVAPPALGREIASPSGPGVRVNLSKSGVGVSVGRTGLRVGVDAKRKKYFSVGLPGTGLSYRTFFGRPVTPETLKKVGYAVIAAVSIGVAVMIVLAIQKV